MLQRYGVTVAVAAMVWALASAAGRLYWGLGGTFGIGALARDVQESLTDPQPGEVGTFGFVDHGLLMLALAVLILATLRPWGESVPQGLLFGLLYLVGGYMVLYGLAGWIGDLLMATGVREIPDGIGEGPVWWYLFLWDPWWMLGGILTFLTAHACRKLWLPGTT